MSDLFLSHSSADVAIARELRSRLEASGFSCFTAPDDVTGRRSWTEQIVEAIDSCRVLVVLISVESIRSPHVSKEVGLAVERGKPLLPVRIEDVMLSGSLAYLLHLVQWVDAFPGRMDLHADLIRQRVDVILAEEESGTDRTAAGERRANAGRSISQAGGTPPLSTGVTGPEPAAAPVAWGAEAATAARDVEDEWRVRGHRRTDAELTRPRPDPRSRPAAGGRMGPTPLRIGVALAAAAAFLGLGFAVGTFLIP